jgi:hypothetical protein
VAAPMMEARPMDLASLRLLSHSAILPSRSGRNWLRPSKNLATASRMDLGAAGDSGSIWAVEHMLMSRASTPLTIFSTSAAIASLC